MNRTFLYLVAFGLILMVGQTGLAQPAATNDTLRPPQYALQFQLAENFDFDSFAGSVLSLREYRADKPDRRFALSLNSGIRSQETESDARHDSTTRQNQSTLNGVSVRITCQQLRPHLTRGPVTAYTALGWTIPFSYSYRPLTEKYSYPDTSYVLRSERRRSLTLGAGFQGNIGVEISIKDWCYWFVEYGLRGEFRWMHSKDIIIRHEFSPNRKNVNRANTLEFDLSPVALTVGAAVMF